MSENRTIYLCLTQLLAIFSTNRTPDHHPASGAHQQIITVDCMTHSASQFHHVDWKSSSEIARTRAGSKKKLVLIVPFISGKEPVVFFNKVEIVGHICAFTWAYTVIRSLLAGNSQ